MLLNIEWLLRTLPLTGKLSRLLLFSILPPWILEYKDFGHKEDTVTVNLPPARWTLPAATKAGEVGPASEVSSCRLRLTFNRLCDE